MGKHVLKVQTDHAYPDSVLLLCENCDAGLKVERWLMLALLTQGDQTLAESITPIWSICWRTKSRVDDSIKRYMSPFN